GGGAGQDAKPGQSKTRLAAHLEFVREKWNPVFPKRQTKAKNSGTVWFRRFQRKSRPDGRLFSCRQRYSPQGCARINPLLMLRRLNGLHPVRLDSYRVVKPLCLTPPC